MTKSKCPTCEEHTTDKYSPLNRRVCVVCNTVKDDKPDSLGEPDW